MKALLVLVLLAGTAAAEPEPPAVDLLTFGVGDVIFERFGHAAICLRYPEATTCFNYGVTDFDEGAPLVWNFLRGTQKFWVEPLSFDDMLVYYVGEDRDIYVQTLPLSPTEARTLEAAIWDSTLPANRTYIYDHFFNNCTTRVRDLIDRATNGKLRANTDAAFPLTFREIGQRGMAADPRLFALTDFILGRQLDEHPTRWSSMFHPDNLRAEVEAHFGVAPVLHHARTGPSFPTSGPSGRLGMFVLAIAFCLPLFASRLARRFERLGLWIAVLYVALWGLVVDVLCVISSIDGIRWNEVALVLTPLDAALPFLSPARRRRYVQIRLAGLALVSLLRVIGMFRQPLWVPLLTATLPLTILALDAQRLGNSRKPQPDPRPEV